MVRYKKNKEKNNKEIRLEQFNSLDYYMKDNSNYRKNCDGRIVRKFSYNFSNKTFE